ncbi:isoprenylcysteine carboxylmethyltransferase family protein [Patescibacteria group bacterium]|nr:isoprenylcysteine carboxylmethyltransferase family protein [Patescibacteria group bacterium]
MLGWIAACLTMLGVLFAIWARIHLGRNWSSVPTAKEGHELITSGPYRFVRHPIYTGILFAAFGAALTGSLFGIGIFILVCAIFLRRISKEEHIMLGLFPNTYPGYQTRTKRLIPFVW